ncbi:7-cyano-7-deazaguanine synthase, partial [bacterium]
SIPVPEQSPDAGEIPSTYVPFRNGIMLSIAAAWAEVIGAGTIFAGFVEEDSSGYPDCREIFVNAMEQSINLGRRPERKLKIVVPLLHMRKSEIIKLGIKLNVPYELTWSCYLGGDNHCGKCPACRLRRKAFSELGIPDPRK